MPRCWDWTLIAVSVSFHSVAILSTLFRLWYRWHTTLLWWDDAWALLGFFGDVACLIATVIEKPIPLNSHPRFFAVGNWIFSLAYPTVMWATRISILTSMVRVSRPEGILRCITFGIGYFFGLMAVAMFALRLQVCFTKACLMDKTLLIVQTITDCTADVLLTALPAWSLRNIRLSRNRKILISSAFCASMVINIVTVIEVVTLFHSKITSGSIVFEHVKVACSMMVCNLLVIVTFVYRVLYKDRTSLDDSADSDEHVFSTVVDVAQVSWISQDIISKGSSSFPRRPSPGVTLYHPWYIRRSPSKIPRSMATSASRSDAEK